MPGVVSGPEYVIFLLGLVASIIYGVVATIWHYVKRKK